MDELRIINDYALLGIFVDVRNIALLDSILRYMNPHRHM
jgi:hypothetical protein